MGEQAFTMFDGVVTFSWSASYLEVGGSNSGILVAMGNTVANMGSFLAPLVGAAALKAHGGDTWPPVFYSVYLVYLASAVCYSVLITTQAAVYSHGTLQDRVNAKQQGSSKKES